MASRADAVAWFVNTTVSALVGVALGFAVVIPVTTIRRARHRAPA